MVDKVKLSLRFFLSSKSKYNTFIVYYLTLLRGVFFYVSQNPKTDFSRARTVLLQVHIFYYCYYTKETTQIRRGKTLRLGKSTRVSVNIAPS